MADRLDRIVPLQAGGAAVPLFCVHPISGSAYAYAGLVDLLGPDQPIYGIEAPGFDDGLTPVRSLPALSAEYAAMLREFRPDGDLQLLGWSMGGVIAFDMARQLRAAGAQVSRIILVDVGLPWVAPLPPEKEIQRRFVHDLLGVAGGSTSDLDSVFRGKPDDIASAETFAAVERSGILPAEIDADMLEDRYIVFRAHIEALFAFEVSYAYDGPVLHIMSSDSDPDYMRWDTAAVDLTELVIPGDHHSIWSGAGLVVLADNIRRVLLADADARDADTRTAQGTR